MRPQSVLCSLMELICELVVELILELALLSAIRSSSRTPCFLSSETPLAKPILSHMGKDSSASSSRNLAPAQMSIFRVSGRP
jgi:hypothetical protein